MSGSVNTRAIRSLAREIWAGLPLAQQTALRRSRAIEGGFALSMPTHIRTVRSLWSKGLALEGGRGLSPLGVLVRAEGLAHDAEQARRRYSRRKHDQ